MTKQRPHYQSDVGHYRAGSYQTGTYDHGYSYGGLGGFQPGPTGYDNQDVASHLDHGDSGPSDGRQFRDRGDPRALGRSGMSPQLRGGPGPGPRGSHAGKGPVNYQRTDAKIHDQVCEMLTDHDEIDASQIHVEVKDGEVTLTGSVLDRAMKVTADEVAGYAAGVKDVHNRLKIGPPAAV